MGLQAGSRGAAALVFATALAASGAGRDMAAPPRPVSSPLLGVTIDSVEDLPQIVESLDSLCRMPTARIVFDETGPERYAAAVRRIHPVSYVMGEILDSYYVRKHAVDDYVSRTRRFLDVLGPWVDIWEIGNEIGGDWLGAPSDVIAKVSGAYDVVKAAGGRTALTLYHDQSSEGMLSWTRQHVPDRIKQGLDYVFVSFYDGDQGGIRPDWPSIFDELASMFPHANVGFGEVGTEFRRLKKDYVTRYYGMQIAQPRFAGGYFWWYYRQDMVPSTKPLHAVLNRAASSGALCDARRTHIQQ
jgi:hypothetical protein